MEKLSLEEESQQRLTESYLSLFGVGIGGGLFLIIIVAGIIFWISKEREEDNEAMEAAEKVQENRRRARGISLDVWGAKKQHETESFIAEP